ncbi:MAG: nucleoside triphosphate pyrophosphohydrolase [Alicyclobacillus sp.]|nr:nucleoside triphosphate pyrophosphohydrolase [Alicyclobacillus sp.]
MPTLYVVGLGPGDWSSLPVGSWERLCSGLPVYLRTRVHPVVAELERRGVHFTALDEVYENSHTFAEVYERIANRLLSAAAVSDVVYAVPGHPWLGEQTVRRLHELAASSGGQVQMVTGPGSSALDALWTALAVDPVDGLLVLDGTALTADDLQPRLHTLVLQVYQPAVAAEVKLTLMEVYPDDYRVTLVRAAGVPGEQKVQAMPLYEIDRIPWVDHLTSLYLPPAQPLSPPLQRDANGVAALVRRLREPGGCPWDRSQTHASLRRYVLEEAYEVAYAIDSGDPDELADELGDLLLQVLLHAQIASESGAFTVRDVYQALADKLIRRHPHVFGGVQASDEAAAQAIWSAAKAAEQPAVTENRTGVLARVRWSRPPWQVAVDVGRRAAEAGFDWPDVWGVLAKVREETGEVEQELRAGRQDQALVELADLLFACMNLVRWLQADADQLLLQAARKFACRVEQMERQLQSRGQTFAGARASELDKLWTDVKAQYPAPSRTEI